MAGGAETPNIAALPAIARLGADRKSHRTTPAAPCADLRQQLLFKGNVNQVVIRDHSEPGTKVVTKIGTTDNVLFKPRL
jgi:hypothetical protein